MIVNPVGYKYARRAALCFSLTSLFHPGTLCLCFGLLVEKQCSRQCQIYLKSQNITQREGSRQLEKVQKRAI